MTASPAMPAVGSFVVLPPAQREQEVQHHQALPQQGWYRGPVARMQPSRWQPGRALPACAKRPPEDNGLLGRGQLPVLGGGWLLWITSHVPALQPQRFQEPLYLLWRGADNGHSPTGKQPCLPR